MCNRVMDVTVMCVIVAEIHVSLRVFMLQNYQLNQKGLLFAKACSEKSSFFHKWSYLVVEYFRLPFYRRDQCFHV